MESLRMHVHAWVPDAFMIMMSLSLNLRAPGAGLARGLGRGALP